METKWRKNIAWLSYIRESSTYQWKAFALENSRYVTVREKHGTYISMENKEWK